MRAIVPICTLVFVLGSVTGTRAQTFDQLRIDIDGKTVSLNGGEQPSAGVMSGPVVIGKTTTAGLAQLTTGCGLAAGANLHPGAISGWNVEVTPLGVGESDAVTFRLHWVRSRDDNRNSSRPSGDLELTLRPGESVPIDMVPLSPLTKPAYDRCKVAITSLLLRVGVSYWPRVEDDRRLVATDLWLVERRQDGTERSQPLSLRGLFNQPAPFYFDTIVDGGVSLDLFGRFRVALDGQTLEVKLETKSRLIENGRSVDVLREGNMFRARKVESVIRLKPGEVVAVELPRLSENDSGAFANRTFSIRIQSRQVR